MLRVELAEEGKKAKLKAQKLQEKLDKKRQEREAEKAAARAAAVPALPTGTMVAARHPSTAPQI